jgi:hypothetical protein
MRTILFVAVLIVSALSAGFVGAQTKQVAPVPGDPLELATGPATIANTPEKRSAILNLLERARQNNNLHVNGMNPFDLKASFNSSGSAGNSGPGALEESWLSGAKWRWSEQLGSYSQLRIFQKGVAYDSNPGSYQPLRLQMIRQAIFWPVAGNFANNMIRVAEASWNGKPVTCALIAGPRAKASQETGRQWIEEEYCIDPATGFLQTYSIAPGTYNVYDYSSAFEFHGHSIARRITIVQNSIPVATVELNEMKDLNSTDDSLFTPTADMRSPGIMLGPPMRFPQVTKNKLAATATGELQPIIIHAVLDVSGRVLEAEALQTSDSALSDAALNLVKNTNYGPLRNHELVQRDVFINVQFVAAQ